MTLSDAASESVTKRWEEASHAYVAKVREDFQGEIEDSQKACCARCCGAKAKKYQPIDIAVRLSLEHLDDKDWNKIITSAQTAAPNTDYHMMVGKWWPDEMKQYGF